MKESKIMGIGYKIGDIIRKDNYYIKIEDIELIGKSMIKLIGEKILQEDLKKEERNKKIDDIINGSQD